MGEKYVQEFGQNIYIHIYIYIMYDLLGDVKAIENSLFTLN